MKQLRIVIALLLATLLQSCGNFKSPEFVGINSIRVDEVNFSKATARLNVNIFNPNRHKLVLNNADVDVYIKGMKIGKLTVDEKNTIAAKSKENCKFVIIVSTKDILKSGISALSDLNTKNIEIKLNGNVEGGYWFYKKNIKIDTTIKP